jgi:hypothetical protein
VKRVYRILAAAALALSFGAVGLGVSASPAAAATCSGISCAGHDPVNAGCAVSSTKTTVGGLATVWNRYSSGCNANWARAQLTTAAFNAGDSLIIIVTTTDSLSQSESMCYPGPSDTGALHEYCYLNQYYSGSGAAYTDMVDGTHVTQAFAYVYDSGFNLLASYEADQ